MGEVDFLLAAFPEELLDLIAATGKGVGLGRRFGGCFWNWRGGKWLTAFLTEFGRGFIGMATLRTATSVWSGCPQNVQNLALSTFSVWQCGHFKESTSHHMLL